MRIFERNKAIVLEIKCYRSLVEEKQINKLRNEKVCISAWIESELASTINGSESAEMVWTYGEWMSTVWLEGYCWRK